MLTIFSEKMLCKISLPKCIDICKEDGQNPKFQFVVVDPVRLNEKSTTLTLSRVGL